MSLSALEKLSLGRELNQHIQESKGASGLQKLTIGRAINAILIKLGYGADQAAAVEPPANEENQEETDQRPAIVVAFLNREFMQQDSETFIRTLTTLEPYVDLYLSLNEVKAGSADWLQEHFPQAA